MNKEPRLRFTDEERSDPALEKPIRKAEKAAARADKAQANIPKKKVRQTVIDPDTGKKASKLTFEDKKKPPSKVSQGVKEAPVHLVAGKLHKEIRETEQDNVGVESAHKSEEAVETGVYLVREGYRSHKLKPYRKAAQAERQLEKANVNVLYQKSLQENPQFSSNPLSRWQQKQAIKKQYAAAKRTGQTAGNTAQAASKTGKAARTVKEKAQQAGAFVMRHKKGFLIAGVLFLIACMLMNTMSSCSMMAQSIGSVLSGTTYPSDDPEMLAVEADYAAREAQLQEEIDNIESSHPGYDEYRYDLGMIGHDPHELAAFLSAVLQGYTRQSAQAELARVFAAQYQLTLTEEVEIRYRTETSTDPETGETTSEEVPYEYYILNVKLTSKPISAVASELLTPEQMEMYQVYRQTMGNKPLLFGGGSPDTSGSEDLSGVQFINGTRPGNPQLVELAKVRWAMWAVIPTGAGMALTAAWNGVPALYPGAITRQVKVSRALQAVSGRVFRGSSLMDNGAQEDMKTSLPAMPFSSIGIWTVLLTMWESSSAPMAAVFIPWREIPAMPARSKVMT